MQSASNHRTISPRTWVLVAMIAFAVGVRLLIHFVPGVLPYNFTPVEAIALFGGAYFADRRLAFITPLAAMVVADTAIGLTLSSEQFASWYPLIPVIYGCIAASVALGFGLRGRVSALRVGAYGVAGSLLFFAVVSFFEWIVGDTDYCRAGIVSCYVAAIPFLKGWLVGTLVWSTILFGGFELMRKRWLMLDMARA